MKPALRKRAGAVRVPAAVSAAIQRRLLEEDWWDAAFAAGLYLATPAEPSTDALLADLLARGALAAVPVRAGTTYRWMGVDPDTRWRRGAFGIREPIRGKPVAASDLRVVIVPGVLFDLQGGRLGHGGGHFDRLLAKTVGLRVGLCPERRLVGNVPMESHDVRMDAVVTESRTLFMPSAAEKLERVTG